MADNDTAAQETTREEPLAFVTDTDDPRVVRDHVRDCLRYRSVHECLGRVLSELPAIGKNQRNTQQNFNFRGIDDVLNALNPLLGRYGVYYVPDVLERVTGERGTKSGGTMYEVSLRVRYTFYGPAGDSVSASGWGEGTDSGDKATAKAMTGAMKYVLFQVLAIATEEQSQTDADRTQPEETTGRRAPAPPQGAPAAGPTPAKEQQVVAVLDRLRPVLESAGGEYPEAWREHVARPGGGAGTYRLETLEQMVTGDRPLCTEESVRVMSDLLDAIEAEQLAAAPCSICGSTRSNRAVVQGVVRCQNASRCAKSAEKKATGGDADEGRGTDEAPSGLVCGGTSGLGCGEIIGDEPGPVYSDAHEPFHAECAMFLGAGGSDESDSAEDVPA